jgi:hypothetical protein
MPVDRVLLKQALGELVRLKAGAENPRGFLAQLYSSALAEWAGQLCVDQGKLRHSVANATRLEPSFLLTSGSISGAGKRGYRRGTEAEAH